MQDGWDGILFPGETLLWQGQPDPRPDWSEISTRDVLLGSAVAGFAVFWTAAAIGAAANGLAGILLPAFGILFLAIGLSKAGGRILWEAWTRRRTWYSLTSQRAFIATDVFGRRSLDAYPIDPRTRIVHENDRHLWFATDFVKTKNGSRRRRIGFTHLPDSKTVHDLMRKVQREAT